MDWYPAATHDPQDTNGGTMVGGTARGTIHTLEGSNLDLGAPYYHIGFKDTGTAVDIKQWRSFAVAAKSLKNGPDPVQTNRQGTRCIQPCIIGYAADSPSLSDRMIRALAEFFVWCEQEHGVPATSPVKWYGPEGFGTQGPGRLTIAAWKTYTGWAGHQHVPDTNDHWDPGKLPWAKIQTVIDELKGAPPVADHTHTAAELKAASVPSWSPWDEYVAAGGSSDTTTGVWNFYRYDAAWFWSKFVKPLAASVTDLVGKVTYLSARVDAINSDTTAPAVDVDAITEQVVAKVIERLTNG